jgi:predicted dehydrogenase
MIHVGVIGLGFMGATHLKAWQKVSHARITALCNPSGRHLDGDFSQVAGNLPGQEPLRLDMGGIQTYRDTADFLADPGLQLVDICAPTPQHHPLTLAALAAGKHVLCEKPFARTSAQAREMIAAAARAQRFLMPAMPLRFWPQWTFLRQAITDGRFGKVLSARFRRVAQPPGWGAFMDGRNSGGALLDLHVHDVDFILHCFGRPSSVFATGYSTVSGAIDHVIAQYQFPSGPIVHAEGTWALADGFGFNASYTANFERATLDYDLARGAEALRLFEPGKAPQVLNLEGEDGFVGELRHIAGCIAMGKAPSVVTAADGLAAVELCEAEERSIHTGQIISL